MKTNMFKAFSSVGVLCFVAVSNATIVDFEDLGVTPGNQLNPASGVSVISQGFEFAPGPDNDSGLNDLHIDNNLVGFGQNGTAVGGTHDDAVLTKVGGGTFSLGSFDYAGFDGNLEKTFRVTGEYFGGGSITTLFTPDGFCDGLGSGVDFETFTMTSAWTNLVKVTWSEHTGSGTTQGLFALDNIDTEAVPEPFSMVLLGTGALAVLRRRKKQA